jgi:IclR family acetate operon transcriptional repressor
MAERSRTTEATRRVIAVLEALGMAEAPLRLTEVARVAGMPVSTAHRLLGALDAAGLARRRVPSRTWVLGPQLFALGARRHAVATVRGHALPFLRRLAGEVAGTAQLGSLEGPLLSIDAQVTAPGLSEPPMREGEFVDAHAVALGRLLLAHLPEDRLVAMLGRRRLAAYTARTVTEAAGLRRALAVIRARGGSVAVEEEQFAAGFAAAAAPLPAPTGRVNHAIGVVVPLAAMRVSSERRLILRALQATAEELRRAILKT